MDFRNLSVGDAPTERVDVSEMLTFTPTDGDGKPYLNGGGEPLVIRFHDVSGLEGRREMLKTSIRYPFVALPKEPSEEDLARAASNEQARQRESWIRAIKGWNLRNGKDGDEIEFSVDNALQFFDLFENVAAVVAEHALALVRAAGNGRRGSDSGPRKKAG